MSMLDVHAQALAAVDEGLHAFLLRFKSDANVVYGFVEGKQDPMFYRNLIERFLPENWHVDLIKAGRKFKVCRTYGAMDWDRFPKSRVAFFMDRDLDFISRPELIVEDENVYVTDGYSIENSVVNERMFLILLIEAYNIADLSSNEEDNARAAFNEDLGLFTDSLGVIMAMIVEWGRVRADVPLDNLALSSIFAFDGGRLTLRPGMADEAQRIQAALDSVGGPPVEPNALNGARAVLEEHGGCSNLTRGKYLLWYLAHALDNFHKEIGRFSVSYRQPPKPKLSLGPGNVLFNAAPRARCPASLRDFIERTYLAYIDAHGGGASAEL